MKKSAKTGLASIQPAHRIRHRAVSASIWRNETENGAMFNVTFQRSYKDGDEWKNSMSFGQRDLLVLGLIAARSFEWIGAQPKNGKPPSPQPPKNEDDVPF